MKLSKRIAAGFLAAAMMATMAFPAFADTTQPTNYYYTKATSGTGWSTSQSAPGITKTYTAPNGWKFAAEKLSLTANATEASKALGTANITYPDSVPTFGDVTITDGATSVNGTFTVTLPTYSKIGTYVYEVTESSTSTKQTGTEYMNAFYMKVQVTAHEEGEDNNKHVVQDAYDVYVTYHTKGQNDALGTKITTVTNKVTTNTNPDPSNPQGSTGNPLDVSKIVKGTAKNDTDKTPIDPDTEYTITVTITAPTVAEGETATAVNYSNIVVKKGTAYDDATVQSNVTQTNGAYTITLKANEHVYFENVPLGATYTVSESEQSSANFTVSYAYKTGNTADGANDSHVISKNGNTAVVTNQGQGINVDTGVILDNAPYIVMIGVVAAAAVVFVISKKRREE